MVGTLDRSLTPLRRVTHHRSDATSPHEERTLYSKPWRNTGVLFKNNRKQTDKHPDYTGSYTDGDGNEYFLDAWIYRRTHGHQILHS